jgi:hypothetical protein
MFKVRRVTYAFAAVAALVLSIGLLTVSPAEAAPAAARTASAPAAAPPDYQICNSEGGQRCMNRNRGGLSNGTLVIAWYEGDPNDDFQWLELGTYCGGGHVTASCPSWGNSALNKMYNGSVIVENYSHGKCLALNSELQPCNADGTVDVLTGCGGESVTCPFSDVLNSYWTGKDHAARWLNFQATLGTKIILNAGSPDLMIQFRNN